MYVVSVYHVNAVLKESYYILVGTHISKESDITRHFLGVASAHTLNQQQRGLFPPYPPPHPQPKTYA